MLMHKKIIFEPYSGLQIFGKGYDVHNNFANTMKYYNVFTPEMRFQRYAVICNRRHFQMHF